VTPNRDAVQVLEMAEAVKFSCVEVLVVAMFTELVTDPLGPVVPWVLTTSCPEEKKMAGPTWPTVPSASVWDTLPPAGGSTTDGLEEIAGVGAHPGGVFGEVQATWPNPRVFTGLPKMLTLSW